MAEPLTFIDYEFHFPSGEPHFVTVQVGRDEYGIRADGRHAFVLRDEPRTERALEVHPPFRVISRTTRTETQEEADARAKASP